ncbi:MAG TPA: RNA polymerase sigma factor [Candidatus Caenarcaniphilales bacterium]|nr:RNA polymerase sigma factor [Candidatus Caenarcaniphilales bacterium]
MQDLVELARQGDRDAFASIAHGSVDRMFAVARRILQDHDRAQDAVQSALLGAWRDLPSLRDPSRFQQWLHRLLVRACYEEARKQRAFSANVRVISHEPAQPDSSGWLADRDQLERGFRRLSVEQRAVVVLHFYVGLGLTEVSEVLAIPEGTVRSRLHYALRALRATRDGTDRRRLRGRLGSEQ